ncbi:glycosyltransferase family 2 protein [Cryobacterium sp. 10I1]|uniref:glycosyltransferase family 2 protein n=1 Tax=unclassified Cryobacterium TaxID=2649013 RepID=UPI002B227ED1|nr:MULTISPECIES: glycosyltransferase family 2 protein [unclassified Cryobacterium]MEB0001342.1 glycosyltransferase family 2 protein [Cryobacterium sp. RTC2.1]MEB0303945.1 glycosyltransferase family 2 protein [Cryobacterium sp. 10I1]
MATELNPPVAAARVAVVTVSYGSELVLRPFLASLSRAAVVPLRVLVADNKPSAAPADVASISADFAAEYLPMESNRGYGHAINEAVKKLPPEIEWVVVSNPDVVVAPGSIDSLLATAESDAAIAAIGPRILSSDGEVYPSARAIPSLRSGVGHALFANIWPSNPWTRRYRRDSTTVLIQRDAGWLSGAFLMVRRSVLDQLHGFDESYFMYFEDVDLGYRIGRLGLRNVYLPSATVVHTGAHSTHTESSRMIRAHHDSAKRFLFKKYPGPFLWPLRVALALGLEARSRVAERHTRL